MTIWIQRHRKFVIGTALALFAAAVVGLYVWSKLFRRVPQSFGTIEEYYKYGSIGTEDETGIPYHIWRALPRMCPEHLPKLADGTPRPGGYEAVGMVWEDGHETPVGTSVKTIGFPRIGITCALCHTATYRTEPDGKVHIVPTGPTQRFDTLAYAGFLSACASDPRFTADNILAEIEKDVELSLADKLLYRTVIIPQTRKGLLRQKEAFAWTKDKHHRESVWGPGRIDPFNPVKFGMLELPVDETVGNSDIQPIWNMELRDGQGLHTDGLNTSLIEVVLTGALGDGATNRSFSEDDFAVVKKLEEVAKYLRTKQPPKYPFPVDQALAARGRDIFTAYCAVCHEQGGKRTGTVIPVDEVATDRHRLDMWTEQAAQAYNEFSKDHSWDFNEFRKTNGYVATPLDGLWLRAPYLHNGSVPTLEDLLMPTHERPKKFYRGYDVYDRHRVGFIHDGEEAKRWGFEYDVSIKGNGNQGHEGAKYGTRLQPDDKRALIEYLKTL